MVDENEAEKAAKILKTKIRERGAIRANITKLSAQISQWFQNLDNVLPVFHELNKALTKIATYESQITPHNEYIVSEVEESQLEEELNSVADYNEKILDAKAELDSMLKMFDRKTEVDTGSHNTTHTSDQLLQEFRRPKLPQLDLIKFDGKPLHWQEFWDCYKTAIHENESMPDHEKFRYLKNLLENEALAVIDGYRCTDANYKSAIEVLTERFGSEQVIINAHLEELLDLPCATMSTDSLQKTYDITEKNIRSLEALGLTTDTFGVVFVPLILSKLPQTIRVELHRRNHNKPWEIKKLREILKEEVVARVMGDWKMGHSNGGERSFTSPHSRSGGPNNRGGGNNNFGGVGSGAALNNNVKPFKPCPFCHESHFAGDCQKYATLESRLNRLGNACQLCFYTTHKTSDCRKTPRRCFHCKKVGEHHSSLCPEEFGAPNSEPAVQPAVKSSAGVASALNPNAAEYSPSQPRSDQVTQTGTATAAIGSTVVHMQTALITLADGQTYRVFFDGGCSRSFIRSEVCHNLNLDIEGTEVLSNGRFEDPQRRTRKYNRVSLDIPCSEGQHISVPLLATDIICCSLYRVPVNKVRYPLLSKIDLADPSPSSPEDARVDILIGLDYYYQFFPIDSERYQLDHNLFLLGSRLGYLLAGTAAPNGDGYDTSMVSAMFVDTQESKIQRFWELEDVGIRDDSYKKDDEFALEQFNQSVKFVDGRYEVGWPWKDGNPPLPDNRQVALQRLKSQMKRLQRAENEKVLEVYHNTIIDQLKTGKIEEVISEETTNALHYLPHHAVVRPDHTTTKLRVVFDASSKAHESLASLNDCLLRGPVLLSDLTGLLLRFRTFPIAVIADIEKAFLQVSLRSSDRDVTRFFWLRDVHAPPTPDNLIIYRFSRVLFGIISSPFLLNAVIKHHLMQLQNPIAKAIEENIYVDNVFIGANSVDEGSETYHATKQIFASGLGMNIREWQTNSPDLLNRIPEADRGMKSSAKVLGMIWDTTSDKLNCTDPKVASLRVNTKRELHQAAARLYDPYGLFSPVIIQGKLLVQETWKAKLKWSQQIPESMKSRWQEVAADYQSVAQLSVDRFILCRNPSTVYELHCFCDASQIAYTAAVYLHAGSETKPQLIISKARLAPIRKLTICRLELLAVLLGARLSKFARSELHISISKVTIWSDSKCVLQWIKANKVTTTFVRNRIREIREHAGNKFRYVPTKLNPADLSSRGCTYAELESNGLWWNGPSFLQMSEEHWPPTDLHDECECTDTNAKPAECAVLNVGEVTSPLSIDAHKFSSLSKLVRVTSYALRFIKGARSSSNSRKSVSDAQHAPTISHIEYYTAFRLWLKHAQQQYISDRDKHRNLFHQLGVFEDNYGVLRCKGRLGNIEISEQERFPVLLPKDHRLTNLIILEMHTSKGHLGPSHTLAELRCRFWVPCGRQQVRKALRECFGCKRQLAKGYKPPEFAPLPDFRVTIQQPFESTGVDYIGPIFVKAPNQAEAVKTWIILFVCASTRAVHLELTENMSTEQFILALRRFTASYGVPKRIISDNAKYFRLADSVLKKLWYELLQSEEIRQFKAKHLIEWLFIPQYSPWMGGFYERLVKSVKESLKRVLGKRYVDFSEMHTIVTEVTSIVNSRPLVLENDIDGPHLTPAHLLGKLPTLGFPASQETFDPDQSFSGEGHVGQKEQVLQRWRKIESSINIFWDIWRKFYLASLRESSKVGFKNRNTAEIKPKINDVVLIQSNLSRSQWPIAVITKLNESRDGLCRSVELRLANGKRTTRPIRLLYPLETSFQVDQSHEFHEPNDSNQRNDSHLSNSQNDPQIMPEKSSRAEISHPVQFRSKRATAKIARQRIQGWVHDMNDSEQSESDF